MEYAQTKGLDVIVLERSGELRTDVHLAELSHTVMVYKRDHTLKMARPTSGDAE